MKDRLDRLHRLFHDQPNADGTCHVINAIGLADQLFHQFGVQNRVDDQPEIRVVLEMRDVRITAGREVVDDRDLMAFGDKFVREMAADKSGSAGDKNLHNTI